MQCRRGGASGIRVDWEKLYDSNLAVSTPLVCAKDCADRNSLTVAAGELTPNLKVRRGVVADTRAALIDAIYGGWQDALAGPDPAGDLLHAGEA